MSSRDEMLSKLRGVDRRPLPLPDVPTFDRSLRPSTEEFRANLARMGGKLVDLPAGMNLDQWIHERFPDARVVCSAVPEVAGTRAIADVVQPTELADVDVGVVRAVFAVAETGSIWLSEAQYRVNALGYLPQHLVALLDPEDIVGNLHHAYRRHEFMTANYSVLMSGPSATADIEGVLIRGAQGVRSLSVVVVPARSQCSSRNCGS